MPVRPLAPELKPTVARRPEVLAPAGDLDALRAALSAGADAVYFGLDDGFNARARASNFSVLALREIVDEVHAAGARAYVTLNTLIFEVELPVVEDRIRAIAEAGVDALIVQDPAVTLLARALAPDLELHASTQMTISSAEGARFAQELGCTRVVVPRELSVSEIAELARGTDVELEVFIHGALCMAWSGQCLSSEAWGGRSANRGQCAQACRMPYDLIVDGEHQPLGDVRYLLSPKDLSGVRAIPALMQIGVHTLKIEGRLKTPAYVMTAVSGIRRWIDAVVEGRAADDDAQQELRRALGRMELTYSRGFSDGFLAGADHRTLVEGRFPKHRGAFVGFVTRVDGNEVTVRYGARDVANAVGDIASPLPALGGDPNAASGAAIERPQIAPGMGVVFDDGTPERKDEPGGPVFGVEPTAEGLILRFGRPGPDLRQVRPGQRIWLTADPAIVRESERSTRRPTQRQSVALTIELSGAVDEPLRLRARAGRHSVEVASTSPLVTATGRGLDAALLREKLGALGGTVYDLVELETSALTPGLALPVSELKSLRRSLVAELDAAREAATPRPVKADKVEDSVRATLRERLRGHASSRRDDNPLLVPLCRNDAHLDAVIDAGLPEVELDWMEMVGLGRAFQRARDAGLKVTIATVRVQKPGEEGFDRRIAALEPDGVLVRHWGGLIHFRDRPTTARPALHGDFSLNVTNSLTALHLLGLGLDTLTAAHDMDATQVFALLRAVPADRVAVTIHHHIATFHTEHCVYAARLSEGRDYRSCGRPCDTRQIALRDHAGDEHPVVVDVGCRNTIFNARAQSAARYVHPLLRAGVRRLRVEFVRESNEEASAVIDAYRRLLDGRSSAEETAAAIRVHEQFGVTAGTMHVAQRA